MGHTHTKLLAGAFSVLSVMQFFMVYDLDRQVNQFTEVASVTTTRLFPRVMNAKLKTVQNRAELRNLEIRKGQSLKDIIENRSLNTTSDIHDNTLTPTKRGLVPVMTPRGVKMVLNSHEVHQAGVTAEPTAVEVK